MRFAFKTSPQNTTWAGMLAIWQAADDIEVFESGWTFDHFYPIFSDSAGPCLEGWITLTALAQATKRLRVAVLVTVIHYRHPAVLPNMAAALDWISNDRHYPGIRASWRRSRCRRTCAWAKTAITPRWWPKPGQSVPKDSISRSSTCRRRMTRRCWNPSPRPSGIRGCKRRKPSDHNLITSGKDWPPL